jgi:hypothetical protein
MPEEKYEMFMYIKEGKEFFTPSERIAILRSDSGDYFVYTYGG